MLTSDTLTNSLVDFTITLIISIIHISLSSLITWSKFQVTAFDEGSLLRLSLNNIWISMDYFRVFDSDFYLFQKHFVAFSLSFIQPYVIYTMKANVTLVTLV